MAALFRLVLFVAFAACAAEASDDIVTISTGAIRGVRNTTNNIRYSVRRPPFAGARATCARTVRLRVAQGVERRTVRARPCRCAALCASCGARAMGRRAQLH